MSVQRGSCTTGTGDGARSGNQLHVIYGSFINSIYLRFLVFGCFFSVCRNIEIHSRQRQTLLSVSSTNAIDFHWWCTTIRYNIDASHAWCTSRRSVCIRIWFYFIWFFSHPIRQTITMNCDDFCIGHVIDIHHFSRCGQETRVIPRILQLRSHWLKSEKESLRLEEAGITKEVTY